MAEYTRRRNDDDAPRRSRDEEPRRTRRGDDDDPPARSRSRDDDAPRDRGRERGRDDEPRGGRDRDEGRGRDREDDRRGGRDRDGERRGGSGSSANYRYQSRTADDARKRSTMGGAGDFDKILRDDIKMFRPNDGDNRIRILPPTWNKPEHFALDIFVNYGVGPDRASYLSLNKMKDGADDPIAEELQRARDTAEEGNKADEKYIKDLTPKRRELIYLIDRDHPKEGVQAWAMPWTLGRDIVRVSIDKENGEVLPIDDPEFGYDVEFTKTGSKDRTEYGGVAIARRSSPLGKSEWLDYAIDNPLDSILQFYDYDHIAKALGGRGEQRERPRGRDDDDDQRGGGRDRDDGRSRDRGRDDPPARSRGREPEPASDALTWELIHDMTATELEDVIDQERLKIDPREAKDDEDLADWICEELKLTKAPAREERSARRRVDDDPEPTGRRRVADDDGADKLSELRNRRRAD